MNKRGDVFFSLTFLSFVAAGPAAARRITAQVKCLLLAASIGLASGTQATAQQTCKPALEFTEVQFSEMRPPALQRQWTAVLSVDASRCTTTSGSFGIFFSRLKENAPEMEFREQFTWHPVSVKVSVDFWADEAVERYWLSDVAACPCRD
jgi:hypothetical protein